MRRFDKARYQLEKKARRRTRTYPLATIAYYGPDDHHATKVVVAILTQTDQMIAMQKWFAEEEDVRLSSAINQQILEFLDQHHAASAAMSDRIIGCPHEEGIDYPLGETCPRCPFWKGRDRWTGEPAS